MEESRGSYLSQGGKPGGGGKLGRLRRRWENNIKMSPQQIAWEWNGLIWFRIGAGGGFL